MHEECVPNTTLLRQVFLGQPDALHAVTSIRPHLHQHLPVAHLSRLECEALDHRKRHPQYPPHCGHLPHDHFQLYTSFLFLDRLGWNALRLVRPKVGLASQRGRAGHCL